MGNLVDNMGTSNNDDGVKIKSATQLLKELKESLDH